MDEARVLADTDGERGARWAWVTAAAAALIAAAWWLRGAAPWSLGVAMGGGVLMLLLGTP